MTRLDEARSFLAKATREKAKWLDRLLQRGAVIFHIDYGFHHVLLIVRMFIVLGAALRFLVPFEGVPDIARPLIIWCLLVFACTAYSVFAFVVWWVASRQIKVPAERYTFGQVEWPTRPIRTRLAWFQIIVDAVAASAFFGCTLNPTSSFFLAYYVAIVSGTVFLREQVRDILKVYLFVVFLLLATVGAIEFCHGSPSSGRSGTRVLFQIAQVGFIQIGRAHVSTPVND